MNISERYPETKNMSFDQKYDFLVSEIGFKNISPLMPVSKKELRKAFRKDQNFNTIPIEKWDANAAYIARLLKDQCGINVSSKSQCVCILKACARQIALD